MTCLKERGLNYIIRSEINGRGHLIISDTVSIEAVFGWRGCKSSPNVLIKVCCMRARICLHTSFFLCLSPFQSEICSHLGFYNVIGRGKGPSLYVNGLTASYKSKEADRIFLLYSNTIFQLLSESIPVATFKFVCIMKNCISHVAQRTFGLVMSLFLSHGGGLCLSLHTSSSWETLPGTKVGARICKNSRGLCFN